MKSSSTNFIRKSRSYFYILKVLWIVLKTFYISECQWVHNIKILQVFIAVVSYLGNNLKWSFILNFVTNSVWYTMCYVVACAFLRKVRKLNILLHRQSGHQSIWLDLINYFFVVISFRVISETIKSLHSMFSFVR